MYQNFSLIGIETVSRTKQIIVEFSTCLNMNLKEDIVISLYERESKTPIDFDFVIEQEKLIIDLDTWPIPNTDYILAITGIKSILDEPLPNNIKKRISFESNVESKASISSPVQFQEVSNLIVEIKEDTNNTNLVNRYYIEISTDNAFNNIVNKFITKDIRTNIFLKENGQYYIRARIQKDDDNYSVWSDVISFIYKYKERKEDYSEPDESVDTDFGDDDPIVDFDDDFKVEIYPQQGDTPSDSLFIQFNHDIDDLDLNDVFIIREDVK